MDYINLLHISDFHLHADQSQRYNQQMVINGLARKLEEVSTTNLNIDAIVFSGDLVHAADDDGYGQARKILETLAEACGRSLDDVIICPGNHDASRLAIQKNSEIIGNARRISKSIDNVNSIFFEDSICSAIDQSFNKFETGTKGLGVEPFNRTNFHSSRYIERLHSVFISINTAALTFGGIGELERDDGQLLFPEIVLADAVANAKTSFPGCMIFVVGHHPLAFLNSVSGEALKNFIMAECEVYLFGHMHKADPQNIQNAFGQCSFIQAGALYEARDRWSGFGIISKTRSSPYVRMSVQKWYSQKKKFSEDAELTDGKYVFLSPEAEKFWADVPQRPDWAELEAWRTSCLIPLLAEECSQTLTTKTLDSVFVEPEFEKDVYVETEEGRELRNKPDVITTIELINGTDNFVISAPSESGKTATIRYCARTIAEMKVTAGTWKAPVILPFDLIKSYVGGVEGLVRSRLPNLPSSINFKDLLRQGLVSIFVDDLALEEGPKKTALSEFIKKYPNCRYIFFTSTPFLHGAGITPTIAVGANFTTLRIKNLKNSQLLSLIEKHGTTDPKSADKLLNRVLLEANALSVPITPVSGTFLIQIFTENDKNPIINRANLIERYVEISLEKFASDEFLAGTFDFHNKADLLSEIAEIMCKTGEFVVSESKFMSWIEDYLYKFGLRYNARELQEYFISARIIERKLDGVGFRLAAFMEYFAARRMEADSGFRDFILSDERYLSYPNEISFYAAISRRDKAWVRELFKRFVENSKLVWATSPEDLRNATLIENFTIPSSDATEEDVLAVERKILDGELTSEGRRELLNSPVSEGNPHGRSAFRPAIHDPGDQWLAQLMLLSSMLKHMELIENELKMEILNSVIHGWLQFTCLSLGTVPTLSIEKSVTLSGVKYEVLFPDNMEVGEIARRLFVYMPIASVKMAYRYLGTEKLQMQLERGLGAETNQVTAGQQFFRVGLMAQMAADGVGQKLEAVSERVGPHKYLSEVMLRQMFELVVRFRLPEQELTFIRKLAATHATKLEATPSRQVGKRKSEIINNLTRSRLVVGIDPQTRDEIKPIKK